MSTKLNGVARRLIPGSDNAVGLAVWGRGREKTWVRLQQTSGRPGYKQCGSCSLEDAKLLEDLFITGRLTLTPVSGLGCSVVTLNSSETGRQ